MQMVYNSDSYVVVRFDGTSGTNGAADPGADGGALHRGGYEIVDKFAGRGLYIEGAVADSFRAGVQALAGDEPDSEAIDDFIAGYTLLAQQPLHMH